MQKGKIIKHIVITALILLLIFFVLVVGSRNDNKTEEYIENANNEKVKFDEISTEMLDFKEGYFPDQFTIDEQLAYEIGDASLNSVFGRADAEMVTSVTYYELQNIYLVTRYKKGQFGGASVIIDKNDGRILCIRGEE